MKGGICMKKARIIALIVSVLSMLFAFAANAFAATPCTGPMCEPVVPKMLRK